MNQIEKTGARAATMHHIPRGLAGFQDLYIVLPKTGRDFAGLRYSHGCDGRLTECTMTESGQVRLGGRAMDSNPGSRIETVRVLMNGGIVQECELARYVPTASDSFRDKTAARWKWNCTLPPNQAGPDDVLLIKAMNSSGLQRVIESETLQRIIQRFV